jgi:hypothetical protein
MTRREEFAGDKRYMDKKSIFSEGHLFVAAIRILEHRHGAPPAMDQICEMLGFGAEQAALISRRLIDDGIVRQVEGAFDGRWTVADYLKLEELPRDLTEPTQLDHALKKFQSEKNKMALKVESIKEQQALKKKDLFAEIEKKLKKDIAKK